ncbi:hypothetical protein RFI_10046 [Reticulomyxa filosa]|uniref:Uncharacterized protein n=1 Tax=Reticulomyxa filosa TaxID=46433 RepID=X6NMD2_RETFI|nr:hypothetical protein RFI_10046 [Reticulomyxa filosa]|eukprot:ETO27088.1 hypothetical protein RFI_10046 [Reticulomyxa filosa]
MLIFPKCMSNFNGDEIIKACVRQIAFDRWKLLSQDKLSIVLSENLEWPEKLKEEKKRNVGRPRKTPLPLNSKGTSTNCERPELQTNEQCSRLTVVICERDICKIENVLADCTSEIMGFLLATVLQRSKLPGSYCKIHGIIKAQKCYVFYLQCTFFILLSKKKKIKQLCAIEEWDLKESQKYAEKEKELREKKRTLFDFILIVFLNICFNSRKKQELQESGKKKRNSTNDN